MNVFELFATLTLDTSGYESELDQAKNKSNGFEQSVLSVAKNVGKIGTAAMAAATTATAAIGKAAVSNYAEYEQLIGGVETLFGDSAKKVISDADQAFKSAGMSANDYMETSIQSAAAMINSLGGDQAQAADLMNMSITDMADNVNKMGTTMESVQDAYRGFSRGNFTMLDNLALGFAGTKEGMQDLLDKAQELSGVEFNIDSYSDIVEAIHVVQTEMGITGTTAKEASDTISGSTASVKSAWENLVTGIGNENADLGALIDDVVSSADTAARNLLPRIEQVLTGIGQVVEGLAPVIVNAIPTLISDVLPQLLESAGSLIRSVGNAIVDNLPTLMDAGTQLIFTLIDGITDALPELVAAAVVIIVTIAEKLTEPDTLFKLSEAAFKIQAALAEGLIKAIPELLKSVPVIIKNLLEVIINYVPNMVKGGEELVRGIGQGILEMVGEAVDIVNELLDKIKEAIFGVVDRAKEWGADMIENFTGGIKSKVSGVVSAVSGIASRVKSFLGFSEPEEGPLSNFSTYAPDMMKLFAQGIKDNEHLVTDQIRSSFDFGNLTTAAAPAVAGGVGGTTNTYNITVNGIEELEDLLNWYQSRQVRARMA